MNAEVRERWVEALLSGRYKQGRYVLRTLDDRFCCLGVLCDISGLHTWTPDKSAFGRLPDTSPSYRYDGSRSALSSSLMNFAGLMPRQEGELIFANDRGEPFDKIAAMIKVF